MLYNIEFEKGEPQKTGNSNQEWPGFKGSLHHYLGFRFAEVKRFSKGEGVKQGFVSNTVSNRQKNRFQVSSETLACIACEPDWIRTNDLLLRRQLLYPTELPVRFRAKIMILKPKA
jgi:hypothetical protein